MFHVVQRVQGHVAVRKDNINSINIFMRTLSEISVGLDDNNFSKESNFPN